MNGLFKDTIVLREIDDTFINIEGNKVRKVNPFNVKMFLNNYNKLSKNTNILIDYRLDILIIYGFLNFDYDILIFDPYNCCVISIYQWFLNKFSTPYGIVSSNIFKKLSYIYLFISYLIAIPDIQWNSFIALENVKNSTSNFLTMDVFIKYIGNQYGKSNEDNIKSLYKEIVNFIKNPITSINKFDIENLTVYDVLDTFKLLYKNNVVIQL